MVFLPIYHNMLLQRNHFFKKDARDRPRNLTGTGTLQLWQCRQDRWEFEAYGVDIISRKDEYDHILTVGSITISWAMVKFRLIKPTASIKATYYIMRYPNNDVTKDQQPFPAKSIEFKFRKTWKPGLDLA